MLEKEFNRRVLMCVFGIALCGISCAMFQFSVFGVDPFQVFAHGLWSLTPLGYGLAYSLINGLLILFMILFNRKMIGLGTVLNMFFLGYIIEYSVKLFGTIFPDPSLAIRIVFLILGIVLLSFSSAVYFVADMGVSTYDWIALTLEEKRGWMFKYCRVGTDLICVLVGAAAFAVSDYSQIVNYVGAGTIITALFMGPIVQFFKETIAMPMRYGREHR